MFFPGSFSYRMKYKDSVPVFELSLLGVSFHLFHPSESAQVMGCNWVSNQEKQMKYLGVLAVSSYLQKACIFVGVESTCDIF